jgi:hypothetical protein
LRIASHVNDAAELCLWALKHNRFPAMKNEQLPSRPRYHLQLCLCSNTEIQIGIAHRRGTIRQGTGASDCSNPLARIAVVRVSGFHYILVFSCVYPALAYAAMNCSADTPAFAFDFTFQPHVCLRLSERKTQSSFTRIVRSLIRATVLLSQDVKVFSRPVPSQDAHGSPACANTYEPSALARSFRYLPVELQELQPSLCSGTVVSFDIRASSILPRLESFAN